MRFSKITLSFLFVLVSNIFVFSQNQVNKYALVNVHPYVNSDLSKIVITYEDGKTESISLPVMASPVKPEAYLNSQIETNTQIVKTLNEMGGKGYKIISTHAIGPTVTYVMEKIE